MRSVIEKIWKEILQIQEIDVDRAFIDLGGTSLAANRLVAKIHRELGVSIPVIRVFEYPTLRQFTKFMTGFDIGINTGSATETETQNQADHAIAIVGMACRFPGANSVEEFWNNLVEGKDTIQHLSPDQLSPEVPAELRNDPRYVRARGLIDQPYAMDASFFDIGPMEAKLIDPQQRVLLEVAYQALEHAAHGPGTIEGRTAVYAGIEDNTYYKTEIAPFPEAEKRAGHFSIMTGNEKDYVAMRIAHKLNLKGPAVSVHTACSTSLVAVIMACKSLRYGECDMALAGGASVHFPTHDGYYFQEGGVFSSDGSCRPFDKDAEGTIFTDGAGIVVLKRLNDAIRDRNTIHAVIKGGAINSDGGDKASFSAPSIAGQATCIIDALRDAGVDPVTIQYVEAHGTATPMGDPIELEALRQAFRKSTQKTQFCGLGSVKSNIGHTTAAAGVASLIKLALSFKNGFLPPTLHYKSPNPGLDIENSPFYVVSQLTEWKPQATPRRAGLSSFGIGGTNSHLILEEAPAAEAFKRPEVVRPVEIFPVSGKTPAQRDQLLAALGELNADARDIAFSLQNGRTRFKSRGARIRMPELPGFEDLIVKNDKIIDEPKLVFMFPGQGSQYIEMGKSLYEYFPEFRATFSKVCEELSRELGLDFRSFIFDSHNKETLENTRYTQPALFALEVSLGRMLLDWGIQPDLMVGHSIGEFAAAHLAGVFSLEDGVKLIAARGRLMASLPTGKMLSVRGPLDQIMNIVGDSLDLASINSPVHCVLAGETEKVKAVQEQLEKQNLPCRLLHTSHAFHSEMMSPVVEPFLGIAQEVQFNAPSYAIISTVTGERMTDAQATDPAYWAGHLRATVRFSPAISKAIDAGGNLFLEVGPRTTLSSLALQHLQHLKIDRGAAISTLGDSPDTAIEIGTFATALAKLWIHGLELPWNQIWSGGNRIPLVPYPFERKDYRFSEGRTPEAAKVVKEEISFVPDAPDETMGDEPEGDPGDSRESLTSELSKLFSDHAGMEISNADTTFVESGFDSLVLMQIGVELGKRFGISVSLRDLMETQNTLSRLSAHIGKVAPQQVQQVQKAKASAAKSRPQPNIQLKAQVTQAQAASAKSLPESSTSTMVSQLIEQQLAQMKEIFELQLQYLTQSQRGQLPLVTPAVMHSAEVAGSVLMSGLAPAPVVNKSGLEAGLIRAKHATPPVPGAFRAKDPDGSGSEAWYRYDSTHQRYEMLG